MTGAWLAGTEPAAEGDWPGRRLGRPTSGPGSVAGLGVRVGAFLLDSLAANLLAGLAYVGGWHPPQGTRGWLVYAAFLLIELVGVSVAGQTVGMRMLGLRVERLDGGRQGVGWIAVRTGLLALAVPPVVVDRDGRGLHDRAAGVVLARLR
jgi:uncharacterized RDD family membrane protein YckC